MLLQPWPIAQTRLLSLQFSPKEHLPILCTSFGESTQVGFKLIQVRPAKGNNKHQLQVYVVVYSLPKANYIQDIPCYATVYDLILAYKECVVLMRLV
jgi:hypothetical protein